MSFKLLSACIVSLFASVGLASESASERLSSSLAPYLDESTFAVVVVDIDSRLIARAEEVLPNLLGEGDDEANERPDVSPLGRVIDQLRDAGGRELCLIVGLHDLSPATGPLVVVTSEKPEQTAELAEVIRKSFRMPGAEGSVNRVEPHAGLVIMGRSPSVERYLQIKSTPRPDLLQPLLAASDGQQPKDQPGAKLVLAPGDDARRVIHGLWPPLPPPLAELDGQLIADEVVHVVAEIAALPQWHGSITIRTRSDNSAATAKQLIDKAWQAAIDAASRGQAASHVEGILRRASQVLTSEQHESTVVIDATHEDPEIRELLSRIVVPLVRESRASAYRNTQMNAFKNIALAMHNFEAVNQALPASAAIVSEEGKPLLSWRVAILPYLDEGELFKQFHLDEPWDSPHNLELVEKIPEIYIAPRHRDLAAEGKTTYLTPVHPESVFPPLAADTEIKKRSLLGRSLHLATGTSYRDIRDGTSNTMMVVEVPPERAVVWTQPADWEVDLARAWQQLLGNSTDGATVTAFCDGSAHAWDHRRDQITDLVPLVITRAGGEVIDWNKW